MYRPLAPVLACTALLAVVPLFTGCATRPPPLAAPEAIEPAGPENPRVRVYGIDGTVLKGELLNGTVTVESGQGALTLLTQHVYSIDITPEGEVVDSDAVRVNGKIQEEVFRLKTEHGVFTLQKERLKTIEFLDNPRPTTEPGEFATDPSTATPAATRAAERREVDPE